MNKENILKVADAIESHAIADLGFNMETYRSEFGYRDRSEHDCETVACIAGWASVVMGSTAKGADAISMNAIDFLELEKDEADELFMATSDAIDLKDVTPAMAVRVLRNAAETGVIDWNKAVNG